ncbi:hypothetical protein HMPREF9699_02114 [Bergeyella zoohelcum ATCC 43767]|uniref:Uncharacterized protein n=1 Tax=Bergeyella zoohelcum ATCC 43767 TaxID=883096 RepID=K1LHK7_9FLAO|nr:hypothetical protein HMPREF9699_02114 [Bergeyella zoohelcum ATCC 43767]SUV65518.1 Uncharacterised protein [Bergeyella zoohelcum]
MKTIYYEYPKEIREKDVVAIRYKLVNFVPYQKGISIER